MKHCTHLYLPNDRNTEPALINSISFILANILYEVKSCFFIADYWQVDFALGATQCSHEKVVQLEAQYP